MNRDELKDMLKTKHINSWNKLYKESPDVRDFLFSLYEIIPKTDLEIMKLFYMLNHDMSSPVLSYCKEEAKFLKYGKGFAKFCNKYDRNLKEKSCPICHESIYSERNKKSKITNNERYGDEIPQRTKTIKDKVKETNLERYGVESHNSNETIKDIKKDSLMRRYGVQNVSQIPGVQDKIKENYKQKTGYEHPLCNPSLIESRKYTCSIRTDLQWERIIQKQKNTNIERYGVETYSRTAEYLDKVKSTNLAKYGCLYYSHSEDYKIGVKHNNLDRRFASASRNDKLLPNFSKNDLLDCPNHTKFEYICSKCHSIVMSGYNSFIVCPCQKHSGVSNSEKELLEFIQTNYDGEVLCNVRNIISPKELDIYIPALNLAFEFNGMYWHSTKYVTNTHHQEKVLLCEELGINLVHIYEDDWNNETKCCIIKQRILNKIQCSNRLYARKCKVREISSSDSKIFVDNHHIQGSCSAAIHIGLYYEEVLVSVMTFGKTRFTEQYEYELIRYCSSGTIVGGASKLLKYFERNYNPKSLMTYADMDWSNGNVYCTIGFNFCSITKPGYFYYDPKLKIRLSRYQCQKHKLVKMGYSSSLTETEICCDKLGYYKIYNSGNLKYFKKY